MLTINQISKSYGAETILSNISFTVNSGEKVALVGPNGCGKSTLIRIITGQESPDDGSVSLFSGTIIGYLPQGFELNLDLTIYSTMLSGIEGLAEAQIQVEKLAQQLAGASGEKLDLILKSYGNALTHFESLGGYSVQHRIDEVLTGLGLGDIPPDRSLAQLSGGQRTRLGLARTIILSPNLLILDEPTNHLDIQALEWLEWFLSGFQGAALIVSHDRTFLDNTVTKVFAINGDTHSGKEYSGNYSDYETAHLREINQQMTDWEDQQAEIERLEADIHRTKHQAISVELTTTSRQPNVRRIAKKVAKKAKSREKKLRRYLESDERIEKPKKGWDMNLEFGNMPRTGQIVVEFKNLGFQYGDETALLSNLKGIITHGQRITLSGNNGSGKTTLLKILIGELKPNTGFVHLGSNVKIGYMPQDQDTLELDSTALSVIQNASPMNETDARNILHNFLFTADQVFTRIDQLSFGERARLILAKLVVEGANFLVLDEPVNHLDIPSREQFEAALSSFPGAILITIHDRAFIKRFATTRWILSNNSLNTNA